MKEIAALLIVIHLIIKEQRLQNKLIKHQSKMVDFYITKKGTEYRYKETKHWITALKERVYKIKYELAVKL